MFLLWCMNVYHYYLKGNWFAAVIVKDFELEHVPVLEVFVTCWKDCIQLQICLLFILKM